MILIDNNGQIIPPGSLHKRRVADFCDGVESWIEIPTSGANAGVVVSASSAAQLGRTMTIPSGSLAFDGTNYSGKISVLGPQISLADWAAVRLRTYFEGGRNTYNTVRMGFIGASGGAYYEQTRGTGVFDGGALKAVASGGGVTTRSVAFSVNSATKRFPISLWLDCTDRQVLLGQDEAVWSEEFFTSGELALGTVRPLIEWEYVHTTANDNARTIGQFTLDLYRK